MIPNCATRKTASPSAPLSAATDESYTDRNGQRVDRAEWHSIVVYGKTAENCAHHLGKGSLVYVEGSLQTRKWKDQQGQDRFTTEIKAQRVQFLDRKADATARPDPSQWEGAQPPAAGGDETDEIPF